MSISISSLQALKDKYNTSARSDETGGTFLAVFLYLIYAAPVGSHSYLDITRHISILYDWLSPIYSPPSVSTGVIHSPFIPSGLRYAANLCSVDIRVAYECYLELVIPMLRKGTNYYV